jgi:hypothetical protein
MRKLLPLLAALAAACAGPHGVRDWSGSQSEVPAVVHLVALDQNDWEKVWERVGRHAPAADLEGNFGVGIFLGDKRPGEYRFAWNYRTEQAGKRTVIGYRVFRVGSAQGPRTRPWTVFLFPRKFAAPDAEITIEDQTPGGAEAL